MTHDNKPSVSAMATYPAVSSSPALISSHLQVRMQAVMSITGLHERLPPLQAARPSVLSGVVDCFSGRTALFTGSTVIHRLVPAM